MIDYYKVLEAKQIKEEDSIILTLVWTTDTRNHEIKVYKKFKNNSEELKEFVKKYKIDF